MIEPFARDLFGAEALSFDLDIAQTGCERDMVATFDFFKSIFENDLT